MTVSGRFDDVTKPLEHGTVSQTVAVLDQRCWVVLLKVSGQDFRDVTDAAAQARCIEDVDDRPRLVGELQPDLSSPLGSHAPFDIPRHHMAQDVLMLQHLDG